VRESRAWGGGPEGFSAAVGTRFKFVAKPLPGWRGFVECEVLEAREPSVLRYSWVGDEKGDVTRVTYRLEPHGGGTRFTFEHTGFTGIGGFLVAKLALGPVRRKMLGVGLTAVLNDVDDEGKLRPGSTLKPRWGSPRATRSRTSLARGSASQRRLDSRRARRRGGPVQAGTISTVSRPSSRRVQGVPAASVVS
jgi:uncharacterized protein YndB with AHSA1/START domain